MTIRNRRRDMHICYIAIYQIYLTSRHIRGQKGGVFGVEEIIYEKGVNYAFFAGLGFGIGGSWVWSGTAVERTSFAELKNICWDEVDVELLCLFLLGDGVGDFLGRGS